MKSCGDADPDPQDLCVVAAMDKFTWTTEILWRKREGMATLWVREGKRARESPTPAWTGFYCFSGHITSGWSSFTMDRLAVGDYLLQTTKERMLLITSKRRMLQLKGESGWTGYTSILGRFSTDLGSWRYSVNICCLNPEWGSFSKSKSHSSLGTMQAWFPTGEPVRGCGSCVLDLTPHWLFQVGAGLHFPRKEWSPITRPTKSWDPFIIY